MWVAFANANTSHIFSAKIFAYMPYLMIQSFNDTFTNDIVSFEQLGPACCIKISADSILKCLFCIQNMGFDISCKESVCMECQSL